MKKFIFPEYVNVFDDDTRKTYSKRWVYPFARAEKHTLKVNDESWVWWIWAFGPLALILLLLFSVSSPKKNINVYEIR